MPLLPHHGEPRRLRRQLSQVHTTDRSLVFYGRPCLMLGIIMTRRQDASSSMDLLVEPPRSPFMCVCLSPRIPSI